MQGTMKYGLGYALVTKIISLTLRNLLHAKRDEIKYMFSSVDKEEEKNILDFGCNLGNITNMIKKAAPKSKVYGADINEYALKYARKRYKHIRFYKTDNKFFEKNKFDIIIVSHVIEHVKNRKELMKNLSRLLSKNGKMIIIIPQERVRGEATIFQLAYNFIRLRFKNPHVVKLCYDDLRDLLDEVGLKVYDKLYTNFIFPNSKTSKFYSLGLAVSASKK